MNHKPIPVEKLTDIEKEKRNRFVDEYLKDFNGAQAGIRMGFSADNARQICNNKYLKEPYVLTLLQEKIRTIPEENILTRQEVLNNIKQIAYTGKKEELRLKAWEKLAKLMGMEIEYIKAEITGKNGTPIITTNMSAEEAAAIYAKEVLKR